MAGGVARILNLGAGVQSTVVLLLSCHGILPPLDCAIFADTQWEPKAVYEHLDWLELEARKYGVPVHRVTAGDIRADALRSQVRGRVTEGGGRWASLPFRTLDAQGNQGMIRRQCTSEYKIQPIEKFIRREILGLKPRQRAPKDVVVDQWFGISWDEIGRAKESRLPWKRHVYPLIGIPEKYLGREWVRQDCIRWFNENYPGRPLVRSACIGCPYKTNVEWRHLREQSPDEWADVVDFDNRIRKCGGMRGDVFLHRDLVPLSDAELDSAEDRGQMSLWNDECDGMCAV